MIIKIRNYRRIIKFSYIIALLSSIAIFNSCAVSFICSDSYQKQSSIIKNSETAYGNYLAGRQAHIRQDYENASFYYMKAIDLGLDNNDILNKTYLLLISTAQIDDAVKYARKSRQAGDGSSIVDLINSVHYFNQGDYKLARTHINLIQDKTYNSLISPLYKAWSYVGENNYNDARKELLKISDVEDLKVVYELHSGMIEEYFGNDNQAGAHYDYIIKDGYRDISFRVLQIISNYLVRQNKKEEAKDLVAKYYGSTNIKEMLVSLTKELEQYDENVPLFINTAQKGASEVFLEVGFLFKSIPNGSDYAHMYLSIAQYFNQNNDVAKMAVADIFEKNSLFDKANLYYNKIPRTSSLYYPAQIKLSNNLSDQEDYDASIQILKDLLKESENSFQILYSLGEAYRLNLDYKSAITYYNKAINNIVYESTKYWPVYYSTAVSYDLSGDWNNAVINLEKALQLSLRNPQVLNYLGYSLLIRKTDSDRAIKLIVEAYQKNSDDSAILDSLGWVYFKLGQYDNAISFLEKASELYPQSAVINDHLGDAYWYAGRKNDAKFQWTSTLDCKDDLNQVDLELINKKLIKGLDENRILELKDKSIKKLLEELNTASK